ncbi:dihydrodipicolinate synthase family protein [Amycolatopsis sp. NBRC 101858]|uniref:dihydrodipicolinate synthase family protein n=1 Tax=Amycolatopsis sp. NBRC 101858 TaxID=3032200 RepID=UPI0024A215C8|nr:dihydrodipicolinate synthase family protein [Amycolatopsis sp. NBRC 101858]GLY36688.1 dihydrodipicolinate synthase family protein [Amycolatopsis sp. NBRC 101858]
MPRAEVLSAAPTLFRDDGALDEAGNTALLTWLHGRVDGVFVAGTTGEFPALDRAERRTLAALALAVFGSDRTIVHVGAASTREAIALTADALAEGATRLAVITPYYLPADAQAVGRHFAAVRDAAGDADVYGYLFPDRTGVTLTPAEFAATGLRGGKLSGAAAARFADFRAALPDARLWSGADTDLAAVARAGGAGIVSGLSAAFPEPFTDLAAAVETGDGAAERSAQARADAVLAALGGTVEGIKEALRQRGIGNGLLRMPASAPDVERIARATG